MALILTESFESDQFAQKIGPNGTFIDLQTITLTTSTPRTGTYCALEGGGSTGWYIPSLGAADTDDVLIASMPIWPPNLPPGEQNLMLFWADGPSGNPSASGTTKHVQITWGGDRKIRAYRGFLPSATLLGTSAPVIPTAGQWYGLEVKVKLSDTVGVVEVRVDRVTVLSLTGIDTKNGGTANVMDRVSFDPDGWYRKDDLYLCNGKGSHNNDFLGAPNCEMRVPDGNGNWSQGAGSDGNSVNNYALVDEVRTGIDTADYVDLAGSGDEDTYSFEDSATFPTDRSVPGLIVWDFAEKTDANARTLSTVARHGGVETAVPAAALTTGYKLLGGVFEQRPDGGDWTVGDVNGAEFGHKAPAGFVRSAAIFAEVLTFAPYVSTGWSVGAVRIG